MSKSRVVFAAAVLIIFGAAVGIVASGLVNTAGAQDDLEGRRALFQKEETTPQDVGLPLPVSGVAANDKYLFVVQGGLIRQFDAESLQPTRQAQAGFGLTGGPRPVSASPVEQPRVLSPNKPVSTKLGPADKDDKDSGDEGGKGGTE